MFFDIYVYKIEYDILFFPSFVNDYPLSFLSH